MGEDGFEKFFDSITPAGSYDAHDPTHRALRYTQEIAWRTGREAGMREAAGICTAIAKRSVGNTQADGSRNVYVYEQGIGAERCEVAILAAIGEGR